MTPFPITDLLRRLAALAYDLLVLCGVLVATSFVAIMARSGEPVPAGNLAFQGFLALQIAAFFIGFWWRGGQTPGMRAWNIRIETAGGLPPAGAVAVVRFAGAVLSVASLGLGLLWMLVDKDGLAWHDRLSHTRVVRCR